MQESNKFSTNGVPSAPSSGTSPFRRLVRLLAPERRDISIVIAFSVGVGILTLATPAAVQALVNSVAFGGLIQPLVVLGILLFAFLALAGAIRTFKTCVVEILQRRIFVRVVNDLAQRLPRVHVTAFDRGHGPELVNRFFDVLTVQKAGATLLLDTVGVILQTLIGLLILAFYHPVLLAFDVVLIACIFFVIFVLGRRAVKTAILESKAKYAVAASLEEIARNPTTFKLAGGPAFARQRADQLAVDYVKARKGHFTVVLRQVIGAVTLQAAAGTALLTLGGWLVIQGQLTLGQLVASELIVSIVLANFAKIGKQLESCYDLLAAVDKLGQLEDLPLERDTGEWRAPVPTGAALQLRDVCFQFDDTHPVFSGLSFDVAAGERVCVIGGHGSGKSTLADLLFGLRHPDRGRIELDGIDLRELSLSAVRASISLVRSIEMIDGTIEENVLAGRSGIDSAAVRAALADVGVLDELRSLPDGLATHLSSTGAPLSLGQSRRLVLARAILSEPRLLVLDDVLDDLDEYARSKVLETLLSPQRQWTVIILSRGDWVHDVIRRVVNLDDLSGRRRPERRSPDRIIPEAPTVS